MDIQLMLLEPPGTSCLCKNHKEGLRIPIRTIEFNEVQLDDETKKLLEELDRLSEVLRKKFNHLEKQIARKGQDFKNEWIRSTDRAAILKRLALMPEHIPAGFGDGWTMPFRVRILKAFTLKETDEIESFDQIKIEAAQEFDSIEKQLSKLEQKFGFPSFSPPLAGPYR